MVSKAEVLGLIPKDASKSVQEICNEVGPDRRDIDFEVSAALMELETEKKIELEDYDFIYREDGGAIIVGKYKRIA